ncbi:hypothetical protein [Paraflavitalea pollutisoli]|uniref:hypothetical protein n=1 Tax=Paraflavitalea pollutisoli TaxID=3034143 RepID=UPI0023EABF81|nr:hypothetical protein [Paraflavitalea sp. H1-2-19X]
MRITPLPRQAWSVYLLILSIFFIVSCKKEQSFEAGKDAELGGTAVFTLVPSGNDCSDASTPGTYIVGKATTIAELVMITVNVTTPGTWTYKTAPVNGFSFAGSGIFDTPGDQLIALVASGTPAAAGTTSFPLKIGGIDCSFDIQVSTTGTDPQGDTYYKATIGGVNYTETVTVTNDYVALSGVSGSNDVSLNASIEHLTSPLPAGSTEMYIDKGIFKNYNTATEAQFKDFFAVNTYPYAPPATNAYQNGNGVIIDWVDKSGVKWSSFHATTVQPSGSSFKIVSIEEIRDPTGIYGLKVKMQFNCTLHKENSTETTVLTNGEMVGLFGKF